MYNEKTDVDYFFLHHVRCDQVIARTKKQRFIVL